MVNVVLWIAIYVLGCTIYDDNIKIKWLDKTEVYIVVTILLVLLNYFSVLQSRPTILFKI